MKPPTEALAAFQAQVTGFCGWCEGASLGSEPERTAGAWLAKLHAAALALPETEPEYDDELPEGSAEDLQQAASNLSFFNGWYYRTVFDPAAQNTEEPVMGDVGDDLLDAYKDIRTGAIHYERGQLKQALWYWSFMHRIHWGKHAVGAMTALHAFSARDH